VGWRTKSFTAEGAHCKSFTLGCAMKSLVTLCAVASLSFSLAAIAADPPATALRAQPGASEASGSVSPAVRFAEGAQVPGEVRPEKRTVSQFSIPIRGKIATGAASGVPAGNHIDDDVARCLAKKTKLERTECQRLGHQNVQGAATRQPR
jgi:hypothetical protein